MKLKNEIIYTTSQVFIISVLLFLLYIVFKSRSYSISDNIFIKDISNNWFNGPIKSIISVHKNEFCPDNHSPMLNEKFITNFKGCDCRKSFYYGLESEIFIDKCSFTQQLVGCKNIFNQGAFARTVGTHDAQIYPLF